MEQFKYLGVVASSDVDNHLSQHRQSAIGCTAVKLMQRLLRGRKRHELPIGSTTSLCTIELETCGLSLWLTEKK